MEGRVNGREAPPLRPRCATVSVCIRGVLSSSMYSDEAFELNTLLVYWEPVQKAVYMHTSDVRRQWKNCLTGGSMFSREDYQHNIVSWV